MNKFFAIGRLTADPVKTTKGDMDICRFTIAVDRRFGDKVTDFFRVVAFKKTAEICNKYLSKGNKVAVIGSIQFSEYTDKDGNKRQGTDVIADEVEFLTPKGEGEKSNPDKLEPVNGDNLPF